MARDQKKIKSQERNRGDGRTNDAAGHPVRHENTRSNSSDRQDVRLEALLKSPRQINDLYERQSI
jgi:hypothetical protein